jgi:hypothetical protein
LGLAYRTLAANGIDKPVLRFSACGNDGGAERGSVESAGAVALDERIKNRA